MQQKISNFNEKYKLELSFASEADSIKQLSHNVDCFKKQVLIIIEKNSTNYQLLSDLYGIVEAVSNYCIQTKNAIIDNQDKCIKACLSIKDMMKQF